MEKQFFEGFADEGYVKSKLSCGLTVYIMEKPQYSSCYAIFGTKYGSIDTRFSKDGGEMINVPEGMPTTLNTNFLKVKTATHLQNTPKQVPMQTHSHLLTEPVICFHAVTDFMKI